MEDLTKIGKFLIVGGAVVAIGGLLVGSGLILVGRYIKFRI